MNVDEAVKIYLLENGRALNVELFTIGILTLQRIFLVKD